MLKGMFGVSAGVVGADSALPGRSQPVHVSPTHFILKTPTQPPFPESLESVVLGTGCFWGTEKAYWRMPGVYTTSVGYAGGYTQHPSYEEVCSERTGHTEAVQIVYDPNVVAFSDILRTFWTSHDPASGMGQGNDRGTQYRSAIYPRTENQMDLALRSREAYQKALEARGKKREISTEIRWAEAGEGQGVEFFYAEDYHQQYLAKPGARPYCSAEPQGVDLPMDIFTGEDAGRLPKVYWDKHAPRPGCTIRFPNEPIKIEEL